MYIAPPILYFILSLSFTVIGINLTGEDPVINVIVTIISQIITTILILYVFRSRFTLELSKPTLRQFSLIPMVATLTLGMSYILGEVLSHILFSEEHRNTVVPPLPVDTYLIFLIIGAVFVAPITEELMFRAIPFKLASNQNFLFLITTSILFGVSHVTTAEDVVRVFIITSIAGYIYARLYRNEKNIIINILSHSLHNAVTILLLVVGIN